MKTEESTLLTSGSIASPSVVRHQPDGTVSLDFRAVRENHSTTWDAALDVSITVERGGRPDLFLVDVDDECPFNCSLARRETGTYAGWCSCEMFDATGVCPHLCALRQRAALGDLDIPGVTE